MFGFCPNPTERHFGKEIINPNNATSAIPVMVLMFHFLILCFLFFLMAIVAVHISKTVLFLPTHFKKIFFFYFFSKCKKYKKSN
jgi:hypothetical protein